jgi:hypothetical protein
MRKSFSKKTPRHRAVGDGAGADAGGVVAVAALVGTDGGDFAAGVHDDARAAVVGAAGIAEHGRALVEEFVVAVRLETHPAAALEEDDGEAGLGEFFGDDSATGAGADDDGVNVFERHGQVGR